MNLEEAIEIFDQIVELCYQIEDPKLLERVEPIIRDSETAEHVSDLARNGEEIQVNINEMEFLEEEEEIILELHKLIEKLSE